MSTTELAADTQSSHDSSPKLTWHGFKTVTKLELLQKTRSARWKLMLLLWFLGVGFICVLLAQTIAVNTVSVEPAGGIIFGVTVYFILFMGLVITPTLSSTAINGERENGTLAILQASLLTPWEITLGKLIASWICAMAFLLVSLPFIFWAFAAGGVTAFSVVCSVLVMSVLLLVVCAVSLYMSATSPKTSASTVMSYLFVVFVSILTIILMIVGAVTFTTETRVKEYGPSTYNSAGIPTECVSNDYVTTRPQTEYLWGLLALNPFVIVADASSPATQSEYMFSDNDLFGQVSYLTRNLRMGTESYYSEEDSWCTSDGQIRTPAERKEFLESGTMGSAVWPYGLALHLIIGGAALWATQRKLQTPYRTLHKGVRIA